MCTIRNLCENINQSDCTNSDSTKTHIYVTYTHFPIHISVNLENIA